MRPVPGPDSCSSYREQGEERFDSRCGLKRGVRGVICASALGVAGFGKRTVLCTCLTGAGLSASYPQGESSESRSFTLPCNLLHEGGNPVRADDWWRWQGPWWPFSMFWAGLLLCSVGLGVWWALVQFVKFCLFLIDLGW